MRLQQPEATAFDLRFKLLGTPVRIHPFFWLMTLVMGGALLNDPDWPVKLTLWVVAVFVSILLHEFGHVWMWRVFGVQASILLHGMGGLAIPEAGDAPRRWQRILVSFAGPAIQLALYALLLVGWLYRRELSEYPNVLFFLSVMTWINLVWALVNLLPIFPLDGGQVVREAFQIAATRSEHTNSTPALVASLWLSIATAGAIGFYLLMPHLNMPQPYPLGGERYYEAILCLMFIIGNFQEMQQLRGGRGEGPMDSDW
jgi:stage IV sporulation protein FB